MKIRQKTVQELKDNLARFLPEGYELVTDNDGQIIVYTNLSVEDRKEGTLKEFSGPVDEQPTLFI